MSDITKPKFPESKNGELRGLYRQRKTLEEDNARREVNLATLSADRAEAHRGTISRQRDDLKQIAARIAALEKAEPKTP